MNWSLVVSILGCGAPPEPEEPAPAPTPPPVPEEVPEDSVREPVWAQHQLKRHMQEHFSSAISAVWYVATGDLGAMKAKVVELETTPTDDLDASLRPLADQLSNAATAWAGMTDRAKAAKQSVVVADRCAACHQQAGAIDPLTPDDVNIPEMTRKGDHVIAPYLLWVGLIVPSDLAWTRGAEHLALPPERANTESQRAAWATLAERAKGASAEQRGEVWAELLTSCVPCHEAGGVTLE